MKITRLFALLSLLPLVGAAGPVPTAEPTTAELEQWFNDDSEFLINEVNEGQLRFIDADPAAAQHQAFNRIRLLPSSHRDGWVELSQCHRGLDGVPLAQVIFPEYELRHLEVTEQQGIGEVAIDANTIQLADLTRGAHLCSRMQIRGHFEAGRFILRNGPFQRRFLDGFYPLVTRIEVDYRDSRLVPVSVLPQAQPGMQVEDNSEVLNITAHFEGVLRTELGFRQR